MNALQFVLIILALLGFLTAIVLKVRQGEQLSRFAFILPIAIAAVLLAVSGVVGGSPTWFNWVVVAVIPITVVTFVVMSFLTDRRRRQREQS